jgi:hypothetical protein
LGGLFSTPKIKVPVTAAPTVTPTDTTKPATLETPTVDALGVTAKTKKKLTATGLSGLKIPTTA